MQDKKKKNLLFRAWLLISEEKTKERRGEERKKERRKEGCEIGKERKRSGGKT